MTLIKYLLKRTWAFWAYNPHFNFQTDYSTALILTMMGKYHFM